MKRYQIQRRPIFSNGAEFQDYLRSFGTVQEAITRLSYEEDRHLGYLWRIKPTEKEEKQCS
nr:MAG TPA: hypothetical protein [Caudoviricetes sp.]